MHAEGTRIYFASLTAAPTAQVDFEQQKAELFMAESVSPWSALDCKLGSLMLGLEPPGCFGADVYAADLHITDPDDDQRFNYGEHLLRAALVYWAVRYCPTLPCFPLARHSSHLLHDQTHSSWPDR